jgi:AP2 domain
MPLSVFVDDDDYEKACGIKWSAKKNGKTYYACGRLNRERVKLHRLVMNAKPGEIIDHRNGVGLDCRKCNLRFATIGQNMANQRKAKGKSSIYKGVSWHKAGNKWMGYVWYQNKRNYLGYFENEIDAAKAYDKRARELFGEFAQCNFPLP